MITHYIYEIVGRKIGCCRNVKKRMDLYKKEEGVRPQYVIRERLHDKTDQEAGDIEHQWADKLGYRRGVHYTISVNAAHFVSHEQRVNGGRKAGNKLLELGIGIFGMSLEERLAAASKGGRRAGELGRSGFHLQTFEQRSAIGQKGGSIAGRKAAEQGLGFCGMSREQRIENGKKGGAAIRAQCPHCGLESNLMILRRWHFDNCPHKSKTNRFRRRT